MNRRNFLATLAAGLTLDPEKALWVPGKKLISIPKRIDPALRWRMAALRRLEEDYKLSPLYQFAPPAPVVRWYRPANLRDIGMTAEQFVKTYRSGR